MKNLILLLILFGLGGWYCYEKYEDKIVPIVSSLMGSSISDSDPRLAEIEAEAKRLFPTKVSERNSWIAVQRRAVEILDSYKPEIAVDVRDEIFAAAKLKFGARFDKRVDYVRAQCSAAEDIKSAMANTSFSDPEIKKLLKLAKEGFSGDYISARASLQRVVWAYTEIKRRGAELPPEDYKKIEPRFINEIYKAPEHALEIFNIYALARHNFLTKSIPAYYGNLRDGIEKTFPDDFVAQYRELNLRLDDANRRGKKMASTMSSNGSPMFVSDFGAEIFRKYVYNLQRNGGDYCACFVEVKGKKVLAFTSDFLDEKSKSVSVDIGGGEKFSSDALFVAKKSSMAICFPKSEQACTPIPAYTRKEIFGGGNINVEIVGLDKTGSRYCAYATVESGVLNTDASTRDKIVRFMRSGALIVERNTSKLVGFLDIISPNTSEFFELYKDAPADVLVKETARGAKWSGLHKVLYKFSKCLSDESAELKIAFVDELAEVSRFDVAQYKSQREKLSKLCESNYAFLGFMIVDSYGFDCENPVLSSVAARYERVFQTGVRISVEKLDYEYSNYMKTVFAAVKGNVAFLAKNFEDGFYYANKEKVSLQVSVYSDLVKTMSDACKSFDKRRFVHADMLEKIDGKSYIPPNGKFEKPNFDSIGGPMRLSN